RLVSDWSSDVCSADLVAAARTLRARRESRSHASGGRDRIISVVASGATFATTSRTSSSARSGGPPGSVRHPILRRHSGAQVENPIRREGGGEGGEDQR